MGIDHEVRDFGNICRLFPLPGVVLFPHAVLPLHIFEHRYRQMTAHALSGDKLITIVQARRPVDSYAPAEPPIEEVGCLGKILRHERLSDGRYNFLVLGCRRVRLIRELTGVPTLYRQAEAELMSDEYSDEPPQPRREALIRLFRTASGSGQALDPDLDTMLASDLPLGPVTDIIAHALGLPPGLKQAFLAECCVDRRADGLIALLHDHVSRLPGDEPGRRSFPPPFSSN